MAIGYEATEWKDGAQGGTPIDAAALNKMENGISEACAAVDLLNEEGNVTTGDIASKAVTTEKIADGAVGLDQLSEEVRDSVSRTETEITGCVAERVAGMVALTARNVTLQPSITRQLGKLPNGFAPRGIRTGVIEYHGDSGYIQVAQDGSVSAFATSAGDYSGQVVFAI